MEDIFERTLSDDEILHAAQAHQESMKTGGQSEIIARFQYAYALVRSNKSQEISHGVSLLEELYYQDKEARRDYLYYIAVGKTRLSDYKRALDCVDQFICHEPENRQAQELRLFIKKKLTKDGLLGMAITGGATLILGGLVSLGISLARK